MNELVFFRHAWLMFVAVTVVNALALKFRGRPYIRERPELAKGYRALFRGILSWGNLPWLVMGAGLELGGVPSIFSYFRPRDGNPYVVAFFAVVVALWLLGFYWIFARRGAEFLVEHPGLLRNDIQSPAVIRIGYCVMIAGGIAGFIFMFTMDIPEFSNWSSPN
jgi:hypothetical protein